MRTTTRANIANEEADKMTRAGNKKLYAQQKAASIKKAKLRDPHTRAALHAWMFEGIGTNPLAV